MSTLIREPARTCCCNDKRTWRPYISSVGLVQESSGRVVSAARQLRTFADPREPKRRPGFPGDPAQREFCKRAPMGCVSLRECDYRVCLSARRCAVAAARHAPRLLLGVARAGLGRPGQADSSGQLQQGTAGPGKARYSDQHDYTYADQLL